jgi:hypothetical protein
MRIKHVAGYERTPWTDDPFDPWTEEEQLAQVLGGRAFKKGGGGGQTTSTVYQSQLPEYARPYFENLMGQAEAVSQEPYIPYEGPRIAGFEDDILAAHQGVRDVNMYGDPANLAAQDYASYGTAQALGASYDPNAMYNTHQAANFYGMDVTPSDYLLGDQGRFGEDTMREYMSPYMDAVTGRMKEEAILDARRQKLLRDDELTRAGAYGGSRQAVGDYLAEEGLLDRLSDIQAEQTQRAFENAQMQFERDRAAGLQAGATDLGAMLQAGIANQGNFLEAQRLGEQSRQYTSGLDYQTQLANEQNRLAAAQTALQGAQTGLQGAGVLGGLGSQFQSDWLGRLQALGGVGQEERALTQQSLDRAYEDFLNQRDYPRQNLGWLSGILQGVPVSPQSNVVQYAPAPNPYSQLLGLGLGGAGLYQAFSGPS